MPSSPTSNSIDPQALPPGAVRISRSGEGVELYFPPLRAAGVALALGAFGAVSSALSALAMLGLVPADASDAHGLLVVALVGAFVAPFMAFGLIFVALAIYMLANSLTVTVGRARITAVRRVFGLSFYRRTIACDEIAAIEPRIAARYQNLFSAEPRYQLIARGQTASRFVIAEDLRGEASMTHVRNLIADVVSLNQSDG